MRKIILVVASAVAFGAATMTTGALAQRLHGGGMGGAAQFGGGHFGGEPHFGGRPEFSGREFKHRDFDRRFAFRRRFFGTDFGFFAAGGSWWYDDDCLSRWERTPSGWRQRLC
jgi:hypothetical protein